MTAAHPTFDGTTVSTTELQLRPDGGRSNGVLPSLSSTHQFLYCYPAGVGAPRKLHGPAHVRRIFGTSGGALKRASALPAVASTWNYVKVLSCAYLVLLPTVVPTSTAVLHQAGPQCLNPRLRLP